MQRALPLLGGRGSGRGNLPGANTYHIDNGVIDGVDVSGQTVTMLNYIPGNILAGNWKTVIFIDDKASAAQAKALENAFTGKLGGPLKDVYRLVGEFLGVERQPITFNVQQGKGTFTLGKAVQADLVPFTGATHQPTAIHDTLFTTIPGSPAYVGKTPRYQVNLPKFGFEIALENHNAIQGTFRFEA